MTDTAPRIVAITTPSCVACRSMAPDLDAVAARHASQVVLERVDATVHPDRARTLGVRSTPTLIAFVDGREVGRVVGRRSRPELERLFDDTAFGSGGTVGRVDPIISSATGLLLVGLAIPTGSIVLGAVGALVAGAGGLQWLIRRRA